MSNSKRQAVVAALMMLSASAIAEELPHSSILNRYGVTADQLPTPAQVEQPEPDPEKSHFQIQPEQPWVKLSTGNGKQPPVTGNISIDNANAREYERCQMIRGQLLQRGGQVISCDNSIRRQDPAFQMP
ncbi:MULTISPECIES: hypothetical protein [unclassified Pseudomonas]|uniref:hypothetical protein n=1 Tax=unclassified Pseudomonas TaxID=196821 RepID=UPI000CD0E722|nr:MULTISPECIES: hypothetical protein [unclassified Pseudomonas]POA35771.1 hypothetical protein C1887_01410 [Pseudomonas sp. GW456-R21]POA71648.1 hypothetical protein C1884_00650 [Pseudomonas sp. GW460-R15]